MNCNIIRILVVIFCFIAVSPAALAAEYGDADVIGWVTTVTLSDTGNGSLADESPLGNAAADAAAYAAGTQLAIINGGDLTGALKAGDATMEHVISVFLYDRELAACEVTPAQLKSLLEFCLSRMTIDYKDLSIDYKASESGAFAQVSGFTLQYDVSAPVGERVVSILLENGPELDLGDQSTLYTLTCTAHLLSGGFGDTGVELSYTRLGISESNALAEYISAGLMGDYQDVDRITVIGSTEDSLYDKFGSVSLLLVVCTVIVFIAIIRIKDKKPHSYDNADRYFRQSPDLDDE